MLKSPLLEALREDPWSEALVEGQVRALRDTILELGRQRFARAPGRKQKAHLEAFTDVPHLKRIRNRLLKAASWADLLATPEGRQGSSGGLTPGTREPELPGRNDLKSPYLEELREKARTEARIEGRTGALREILLRLGRQRFGKAASRKQKAQLEALTALTHLERIRDRLLTAASWADLVATP